MAAEVTSGDRAGQRAWEWARPRLALISVAGIVAVIGGFTAATSYGHERDLALRNGQPGWAACLIPFAVDGIVAAASIVLLWAGWHGIAGWGRLWRPRTWAAVGMAATIAANYASDLRFWWLSPAVSASCGVSLVLITDIAFWLMAEQRKLTVPDQPPAGAGHSCPAPPVSLAEAVPLARAVLQELGQPAGEQALADRFGTTRHEIRKLLPATAGTAAMNGASA